MTASTKTAVWRVVEILVGLMCTFAVASTGWVLSEFAGVKAELRAAEVDRTKQQAELVNLRECHDDDKVELIGLAKEVSDHRTSLAVLVADMGHVRKTVDSIAEKVDRIERRLPIAVSVVASPPP